MTKTALPPKKTKIVCTIGPASQSRAVIEQLIANGMNVARINFAHGDLNGHAQVIAELRAAAAALGKRVAILGDLPGPKMRIGRLEKEPIDLLRGQPFIIQTDEIVGDNRRVSMGFPDLPRIVKPGDLIYVNDGYIQLEVERAAGQEIHCRVRVGGELRSYKGVNFPGIDLGISAFTEHDRQFLQFAAEQKLEAVSQSFVQDARDIEAVRNAATALGYTPFIIAKIERSRAVDNLDEILGSADGLMVARGDLGVEIPFAQVAVIQKEIIRRANLRGKPVITATQMLESMIVNRRPTRAEVSDVANAIEDGTDCTMLSGETAVGSYPAEAVAAMAEIARFMEEKQKSKLLATLLEAGKTRGELRRPDQISLSVYFAVEALQPNVVFARTRSGAAARNLARFRLPVWIVALSQSDKTCQELLFSYGVYPVHQPELPGSWARTAVDWLEQHKLDAELAILVEESDTRRERDTTLIEIIDLR
jgi:pyruvate kinase